MRLFDVRKPRGFRHSYIYYDERRERLKVMEERARRELGMIPPEEFRPEDLRGTFVRSTKYLLREKEREAAGKRRLHYGVALFVILLLAALMRYLMAG